MAPSLNVDVEIRFRNGVDIAARFDLPLHPGVTALVGPSGAGKTTILRCLAGLERPQRGEIRFGDEVWFAPDRFCPPQRRRVGFVFQDDALFPHLTVRQNVAYGLAHLSRPQREARVEAVLRLVGAHQLADRHPQTLSGGQRRRVALARALAPGPRLLLLDEPLSALDPQARTELGRLLARWLRTAGIPAILVTHDRDEARLLADHMVVIIDGQVRQVGAVDEVFRRPADVDVARWAGFENLFPARVVDREGPVTRLAVGNGQLVVHQRPASLPPPPLWVAIRPEDVRVAPASTADGGALSAIPTEAANRWETVIRGLEPMGPGYRLELEAVDADLTLVAFWGGSASFPPFPLKLDGSQGTKAVAWIPPDGIRLVTDRRATR